MLFDIATAAEALEELLDHERELILEGKLTGLAQNLRQKDQLIARLGKGPDEVVLKRLRHKAERNQALLAAAARGLKAARERLGALTGSGQPMRTYGADGTARNLGQAPQKPGINHRA